MATIVLSDVGAAIGGGFGGTVLGLSGAVIGRAVGATLGRVIDQRLMGSGSSVVEVGRVERIRVMGASEGASIGQVSSGVLTIDVAATLTGRKFYRVIIPSSPGL